MKKVELERLHTMQKRNPLASQACSQSALDKLWQIGDVASIPHYCSVQLMAESILKSTMVSDPGKNQAINILVRNSYFSGRRDERRETGQALGIPWYEN